MGAVRSNALVPAATEHVLVRCPAFLQVLSAGPCVAGSLCSSGRISSRLGTYLANNIVARCARWFSSFPSGLPSARENELFRLRVRLSERSVSIVRSGWFLGNLHCARDDGVIDRHEFDSLVSHLVGFPLCCTAGCIMRSGLRLECYIPHFDARVRLPC